MNKLIRHENDMVDFVLDNGILSDTIFEPSQGNYLVSEHSKCHHEWNGVWVNGKIPEGVVDIRCCGYCKSYKVKIERK